MAKIFGSATGKAPMYDSRNPTWKRYHWFIDLNFLNSIFL
jgi:hypothetical protein